jgi:hypothetical protein
MESWENAAESDKIIKNALSMLYEKNENLLHTILNPDLPRLRTSSKVIKARSATLSSGEELLIRIGLDAWDGSGGIHFNELYQKLDPENFQKMLLFLNYLYSPRKTILF